MDMTTNKLVCENRRQCPELVLSNDFVSPSKSCCRISPNTFPIFSFLLALVIGGKGSSPSDIIGEEGKEG